jgi:ABC-2 type transport system ATP-binding protein
MPRSVVTVRALSKRYRRVIALADVSLDVYEGEIFGLIGPNGAGKTTTMECIQGSRRKDGGEITVLGLDPHRDATAIRRRIGVQHQEAHLQKRIKVWEAVDLWASLYDRERVVDADMLLTRLGLAGKRDARFMNLSGGQKQRLFIALALIHQPELVFLDELTTGLDPQARRATVFLTTHLMEEAERLCDRVAIIEHGRVIEMGTPRELVERHCPERRVVYSTQENGTERVHELRGEGDDFVTDVIHRIAQDGTRVRGFRTEMPTLEDVFLKLTGRAIRD